MRTGIWLIGARGSVAVTATVGAFALKARLTDTTGCVTELPPLSSPALPGWGELVFGGHDIVSTPVVKKAEALAAAGVLPGRLVAALTDELTDHEDNIRPLPTADTQEHAAQLIAADIAGFRARHSLDLVVVVNVSTTEPLFDDSSATLGSLPGSSLAAYAAFSVGCPFIDFTPSTGARLPFLDAFARSRNVVYAGNDGKTGETLVKSVLAPMFAMRNLRVRSWSGLNLLGGGDGANLADPAANAAKVASKQRVLGDALGYEPSGTSRIDYVEEIGDFKTAWDLVTFQGFLGTGMRVEFTWHGCDSALAAPLVLDLARLTAAAQRSGRSGPLPELGFFFKDPIGDGPSALAEQWALLVGLVSSFSAPSASAPSASGPSASGPSASGPFDDAASLPSSPSSSEDGR
ncbi:inositol-3-phosphate synthase [Actinoplanes sp. NPDC089786]|uniref:inositol-3-phosphate synthase n=1 Tax=Actinoplanes sp. NPDC089786 TaxID=3155185 RepID=UPI00342BF374